MINIVKSSDKKVMGRREWQLLFRISLQRPKLTMKRKRGKFSSQTLGTYIVTKDDKRLKANSIRAAEAAHGEGKGHPAAGWEKTE